MIHPNRAVIVIWTALALAIVGWAAAADPSPAAMPTADADRPAADTKFLQTYDMAWWSVDGGGGSSGGGVFVLTGSIGQPDAGSAGGCGTAMAGGVWAGPEPCSTPLFCDGFESGGTGAWSSVMP